MSSRFKLLQHTLLMLCCSSFAIASEDLTDTDCQCRDPDGSMRNLGTVECVDITGEKYLVRCEMSTNTPYWRKIKGGSGCPAA